MRFVKLKSLFIFSLLFSLILSSLPMRVYADSATEVEIQFKAEPVSATLGEGFEEDLEKTGLQEEQIQIDLDKYMRLGFFFKIKDPLKEIEITDGALNYVSPDWLKLDWDGNLVVNKQATKELVEEIQEQGIKVVPCLSNDYYSQLSSLVFNNVEEFLDDLEEVMEIYGFDGINYDFENVYDRERDLQTEFVRLLKERFPDKHISTSLIANPHNWQSGWHASYDFAKLSEYSDHVVLMSYELMFYTRYNDNTTSNYGAAVAGEDAVIEAIEDLLERGVEPSKILLGIPLYARFWFERPLNEDDPITDKQKALSSSAGVALGHLQVNRILNYPRVKEIDHTFEEETKTDRTTFRVDTNIRFPFLDLDPGYYTIYHESIESYLYKMNLMEKYDLAGYAAWAVGLEDPNFWPALGGMGTEKEVELTDRDFSDIKGHWAEEQILYGAQRNWLSWYEGEDFSPNEVVNRAETVATFRRLLDLTMEEEDEAKEFVDVDLEHWAYEDIRILTYHEVIHGTSTKEPYTFEPEGSLTRAQIAAIVDRIIFSGYEDDDEGDILDTFEDAETMTDHWARISLARMVEAGLLYGYDDGTMRPDKTLTRAEFMAVLQRADNLFLQHLN